MSQVSPVPTSPAGASGRAPSARPAKGRAARTSLLKKFEPLIISLGAIAVTLLLFGIFLAIDGLNPLEVYEVMFRGAFGTWFSFQNTLQRSAPLMLTALCTALPMQLGLLVIGGEGALVVGGVSAAVAGLAMKDSEPYAVLGAMLFAGALSGGLWIALVGALRAYRGVNETISSLLMSYIAIALMNHLVEGSLRDPESLNKPATRHIGDVNMLHSKSRCTLGPGLRLARLPVGVRVDEAHHFRLCGSHDWRKHARRIAERASRAAVNGFDLLFGGRRRRDCRHGRGRSRSRTRQCITRLRLRLYRDPGGVRGAPKPARRRSCRALAGRNWRERRPLAAQFQSAGCQRERLAGSFIHGHSGQRNVVRQARPVELCATGDGR
jgi:hypothetical protein